MRTILKIFFTAEGVNSWAVLGCLLIASLLEGVGFVSLVPLLTVAGGVQEEDPSPLTEFVSDTMLSLGIPMDIGILIFFFITMMTLTSLLNFLAMVYVGSSVAEFSTGIRLRLIRSIFKVRWSYLIHNPIGRFTNAIGAQANKASRAYELAATFFAQAIKSIVYLAASFVISWAITLIAIAISLIIVISLHSLVRMARKAGARQTQTMRELVIYLTDTLINIKPLKAMTRQSAFTHLIEKKIRALKRAIRYDIISSEGLKNSQDIFITAILGTGFYISITYFQMSVVDLIVVGLMLKKSTTAITKIQRVYQQSMNVEPPYLEIMELIDETRAVPEQSTGTRDATFERGGCFENVGFSHGDHEVLRSVSLEIPVGTVTVLTGPSGSGKTTLVDILMGLYAPDSGRVLIDDTSLAEINLDSWRRMIGYVPQEPLLFHDNIFTNISLGDPEIGKEEVRTALRMAGALDFIDAMPEGLMTVTGQHGAKLSGGQRQRIAIARALVHRPRLLILDEVTSALDAITEKEICSNIEQLSGEATILAITHRPALLEIADRVYSISEGTVVESGPVHPTDTVSGP